MTSTAHPFWQPDALCLALKGTWLARTPPLGTPIFGAAIDTRQLKPGEIFFALQGEKTNGHAFLHQAREAQAGLAVVDDPAAAGTLPEGLAIVQVDDARAALSRLAQAWRSLLCSTRFIAITGSNGKTTTTRLLQACLQDSFTVRSSRRSFNNDLGVPLTILSVRPTDHCVICEVGANEPGEIEPLSRIIKPCAVVITHIGCAHMQGFGSRDAVAKEKASLVRHLRPFDDRTPGLIVSPAENPALDQQLSAWLAHESPHDMTHIRVGESPDADCVLSSIVQESTHITWRLNGQPMRMAGLGTHNASNAAAAVTVARWCGVEDAAIFQALDAFTMPDMRLNLHEYGDIRVLNDAYNANPDSMLAGLRTLKAVANKDSRRVAILGDMLELGEIQTQAHQTIARAIVTEELADCVILIGPRAAAMAPILQKTTREVHLFDPISAKNQTAEHVTRLLCPGDTVLLKGSRCMQLERILEAHAPNQSHAHPAHTHTRV